MKTYIESLDLLRGLCIMLMVFINFFDEIAKVSILKAQSGLYIDLLVTSMAPNVFITVMGFLLVMSERYKAKPIVEKAIKLLLLGYVINLMRVPAPQLIGNLLGITHYEDLPRQAIYHLSLIDIYSFVGYALLLVWPLTYVRLSYWSYFVLGILSFAAASFGQELLGLLPGYIKMGGAYIFVGEPKNVYFPIFPWIAYLWLGIGLGGFYLKHGRQVFYKMIARIGLLCVGIGYPIFRLNFTETFSMLNNFYKHDYTVGVLLVGITLLALVVAEKCFYRFPRFIKGNLIFTSRHIVKMYFLSWVFTGWFVTLHGLNNTFGICESVLGATVIYLLSLLCLRYVEKLRIKPINRRLEGICETSRLNT